MKTFELEDVKTFAAELTASAERCDNGQGMYCFTLDKALSHYADLCCKYLDGVRGWANAVFTGAVKFDPNSERMWIESGKRLIIQAAHAHYYATKEHVPCQLDYYDPLGSALRQVGIIVEHWVSPQLAVSPAPRRKVKPTAEETEEVRRRLEALPPLPSNWEPVDVKQQQILKKIKKGRRA